MWSDLQKPWQASFELAWEAYCENCTPIGAVVTGADGGIISRGRNRVYEKRFPGGHSNGQPLAHAEMEALHGLDYDAVDPHACILYTTTEPCPMCMGTFYMSGLRTLLFAARDPFAGSVNLLGTTWYLKRKPIKVYGPDPALETAIVSLYVEQELGFHAGKIPEDLYWEIYGRSIPEGIALGRRLFEFNKCKEMRENGRAASEVYDSLGQLMN